jgi:hypothetical protein
MELCPSCSTPSRPGAKFCTICGFRFANGDPDPAPSPGATAEDPPAPASNDVEPADADGGWPSQPALDPVAASDLLWAPPPAIGPENPQAQGEGGSKAAPSADWSSGAERTWPAQSSAPASQVVEPINNGEEQETAVFAVPMPAATGEHVLGAAFDPEARDRATRLLDELRAAIDAIGRDGAAPSLAPASVSDLSGVISELEIAVTPPGAVNPEALAELRDALLAARDRPKDLDTMVDLAGRIDGMVALVIAYDRTIAAIERALDALRRE